MLDEESKGLIKATTEGLAKGIAQEVPIYKDLLQPAVKEAGKGISAAVRIAMSPLTGVVWAFDTIMKFLEPELEERLVGIEPDILVSPDPVVAGPAIEALRFLANEHELRGLFANIIASSMKGEFTHPSFVEILKNLSANDAIFLQHLRKMNYLCYCNFWTGDNWRTLFDTLYEDLPNPLSNYGPNDVIVNLTRLGLITTYEKERQAHEEIKNTYYIQNDPIVTDSLIVSYHYNYFTDFGIKFAKACL